MEEVFCPRFHHAVELVGKRWSGAVLRALMLGKTGYVELREAIPGLSDTLLSARLKELQAEGLVDRHVDLGPPLRARYTLTEKGRALEGAVSALSQWAEEWIPVQLAGAASPRPPAGAAPPVAEAESAAVAPARRESPQRTPGRR